MSRKYIKKRIEQDFVYPNNERKLYDTEIVHDINDNCVSGSVITLSATTFSNTGITLTWSVSWDRNGAERFIQDSNLLSIASLHVIIAGQSYLKPWQTIDAITTTATTLNTATISSNVTILPSDFGETNFVSGDYFFEIRLIGHRCIYPICSTLSLNIITPTPTPTATPTPTPTGPTPTPTATPTPTPTPTLTGSCECYSVLNETGGQLTYNYTPCGGVNDVYVIGAGQTDYVCSEIVPTGDSGVTITACGVSCVSDPCLPCA